jgi:hypothetical protein
LNLDVASATSLDAKSERKQRPTCKSVDRLGALLRSMIASAPNENSVESGRIGSSLTLEDAPWIFCVERKTLPADHSAPWLEFSRRLPTAGAQMATYSRLSADDQNDQQRHQDSSDDEHGVNVVFHDRPL